MPPPTTRTSKVVPSRAAKSRARIRKVSYSRRLSMDDLTQRRQRSRARGETNPKIEGSRTRPTRLRRDNGAVRSYWNDHIHDLEISSHRPGSREFFADLDQYHFEKLHHLPRLIDFNAYRGKRVLDVGCGAGTDLVRFAKGGALVSGVDLSSSAVALAKQNFAQQGLAADLREADGEQLPFDDNAFDLVFAHGVVQYTGRDKSLVDECRRGLRAGGPPRFQGYNPASWPDGPLEGQKGPPRPARAP